MRGWAKMLGWLALAAAVGCSSPGGGRLSLFPEGYRLTPEARAIRAETPPPPDIPRELEKTVAGPYVVEPSDVLVVYPASLDSPIRLPGDQPVLPDGTINLGRYGRMMVAGKTLEQIEREVNVLLARDIKDTGPMVVRIVSRESKVFYVQGEVNSPGAFPLRGREAVLDAIIAAGGLTNSANKRGIILSRPTAPDSCRIVLPVRYNDIVQLGDTTTNYQIRCGDRVFVPSEGLWESLCRIFGKKDDCSGPQVGCGPGAAVKPGPDLYLPYRVPAALEVPRPPVPQQGVVLPPPGQVRP